MEWINIKDKLPEIDKEVLVYDGKNFSIMWIAVDKNDRLTNNKFWWMDSTTFDYQTELKEFLWWMKLPEPPEEIIK